MNNVEISVKVNGKEVPLSNISMKTIEDIRNQERTYKIGDVFSLGDYGDNRVKLVLSGAFAHSYVLLNPRKNWLWNQGKKYTPRNIQKITRKEIDEWGEEWEFVHEDN